MTAVCAMQGRVCRILLVPGLVCSRRAGLLGTGGPQLTLIERRQLLRQLSLSPCGVIFTHGGLCDKCVPAAVYNTMLHDLVRTVHVGAGLFESWQSGAYAVSKHTLGISMFLCRPARLSCK